MSGERKVEREEKDDKKKWRRMERSYGSFERSLQLPEGVDPQSVQASYDHGILKIVFPKPERTEAKAGKEVEIK